MSGKANLVVIGTDLRRTTISVTPSTYLSDVLESACNNLKLSPSHYLLRHGDKLVDLSRTYRQHGLPSGAKLNLVVKSNTPSVIQVALQLPPAEAGVGQNGRLMAKFPSNFSLWQILRQFESGTANPGKNLNFTARGVAQTVNGASSGSGQLFYEVPVLTIMGRVFDKVSDFKKDLSQLGFNTGNVLVRLEYRKTDQTFHDAMVEIGQLFRDEDKDQAQTDAKEGPQPPAAESSAAPQGPELTPVSADAAAEPDATSPTPGTTELTPTPADLSKPPTHESMDVEAYSPPPAPTGASSTGEPLQPMTVFAAPSGTVPAAALLSSSIPDSEYTPSIAHAQLHQARLQESSRNQRLPSDRELEARAAAESAKQAAITSVTVKVRFPDTTSAQWQLGRDATGATVYAAVRGVMRDPAQKFHLVLSTAAKGPLTIRDEDDGKEGSRLIQGYRFRGAVLLNLVWDDAVAPATRRLPFLRQDVAQLAQQVVVPDLPDAGVEDEAGARKVNLAPKEEKGEGSGEKKRPKWLKLPGRK